jgi:hypothetical protein
MSERHASCSCAAVRVSASGEPVRISICHCLACQRRTGSVFAAQARFPRERVRIEGQARDYVRIGDGGTAARFRFCPSCGATVYFTIDDAPGLIAIPLGAFADPQFPPPRVSIYESRRHAWVGVPADAERFD